MDQNLRTKLEEFVSIKEKESDKYFAWLRNIIGMAITLMGVLISLRNVNNENKYANLLFAISISLIALGIITGALLLYVEIHLLRKEIEIRNEWIKNLINGIADKFEIETIPNPWYFKLVQFLCYTSFLFAIVGLALLTYFN
jgi:hypothetical protein